MKQFIFFLALIPCLIFGQNDLVKWNNDSNSGKAPNIFYSHINANSVKAGEANNINFSNSGANSSGFFMTPVPQNTSLQNQSYIEFNISADSGYKINLSKFVFTAWSEHDLMKFQVRYSKDASFTNNIITSIPETTIGTTQENFEVNLSGVTVNENENLYLRIYFYGRVSNWGNSPAFKIKRSPSGGDANEFGPSFKGTILTTNNEFIPIELVKWYKEDKSASILYNGATSTSIQGINSITWGVHNQFYQKIIQWNENNLNLNNFTEFTIGANELHKIFLESFNLKIRKTANNTAYFRIRYSKDRNNFNTTFTESNIGLGTLNTSYTSYSVNFDNLLLSPQETLYIRVYFYASDSNESHIQRSEQNATGPVIKGRIGPKDDCLFVAQWNGTTWNREPNLETAAVIIGNYDTSSNGNFKSCSCEVKPGATLTVGNGSNNDYITIKKELINNGTIIIKNNANFIQIEDSAENSGNGTFSVERITNPMNKFGYTYWGAPVSTTYGAIQWYSEEDNSFTSIPTSNITNIYAWNPNNNPNSTTGAQIGWIYLDMNWSIPAGSGFIAKAPNSFGNTHKKIKAKFTGAPNNGNISQEITKNTIGVNPKMNFLSNPYPSAINIDLFLKEYGQADQNGNKIVTPTIYLWTHASEPLFESNGSYSYSNSDFATYTLAGGTRTEEATADPTNRTPKGMIASGQGFFIEGGNIDDASVTFKNSYRYTLTGSEPTEINNGHFFRTMNPEENNDGISETTELEKNRFWLNILGNNALFKQTLVSYMTSATNQIDMFDGALYNGGNTINLYSIIENKPFTIQSKALPFENTDIIPLGYKVPSAGTYTIELDNFDGLFENQNIYLRDVLTETETNLKEGAYEFVSESGTFEQRFKIIFATEEDLSTNVPTIDNNWVVYSKDNQFQVESIGFEIKNIVIYDLLGRVVYEQNGINSTSHTIQKVNAKQVLIVKVTSTENQVSTKKVVN